MSRRSSARAGIARERLVDDALQFARRADAGGRGCISSRTRPTVTVDGWIPLDVRSGELTVFDPMHGRRGRARVRRSPAGTFDAYLQLLPGESLVVVGRIRSRPGTVTDLSTPRARPPSFKARGRFASSRAGQALPAARTIERLASWTVLGGDDVKRFSGTAEYTMTFPRPAGTAEAWQLDLGRVHDSARVRLNGRELGDPVRSRFSHHDRRRAAVRDERAGSVRAPT